VTSNDHNKHKTPLILVTTELIIYNLGINQTAKKYYCHPTIKWLKYDSSFVHQNHIFVQNLIYPFLNQFQSITL